MTLPEIEAMQATLAELAALHSAEVEGPPESDMQREVFPLASSDFKAVGELEDIVETGEELEEFDPEGDHWRLLSDGEDDQ